MPRYGGSSSASTGPVNTLSLRSCTRACSSTWSSSPTQSSLDLVELRRLRRCIREPEGARCSPEPPTSGRLPDRVVPSHEMASVEIVVGVDVRPRLKFGGDAVVQLPPVVARHLHEVRAVDVHARHRSEAPVGVEHHREVLVGELDGCHGLRVAQPRHRRRHTEESGIEAGRFARRTRSRGHVRRRRRRSFIRVHDVPPCPGFIHWGFLGTRCTLQPERRHQGPPGRGAVDVPVRPADETLLWARRRSRPGRIERNAMPDRDEIGAAAASARRSSPSTRMHDVSDETTRLVDLVLDYSRRRMLSRDIPLDKPISDFELSRLAGRSIDEHGIGAARALSRFEHVLAPACITTDHPQYLSFIPTAPDEGLHRLRPRGLGKCAVRRLVARGRRRRLRRERGARLARRRVRPARDGGRRVRAGRHPRQPLGARRGS